MPYCTGKSKMSNIRKNSYSHASEGITDNLFKHVIDLTIKGFLRLFPITNEIFLFMLKRYPVDFLEEDVITKPNERYYCLMKLFVTKAELNVRKLYLPAKNMLICSI